MGAQPVTYKPTLPTLAADVASVFPELGGRSLAVSEIEPFDNQTNVPTLPICFVALVAETGSQSAHGGGNITVTDDILVHFAFKPVKYKNDENRDTPFFAFYDYEPIRDRLLTLTQNWRSPRGFGLQYTNMDISATSYAVYITFRFRSTGKWCVPEELAAQPHDISIAYNMCLPKNTVPCADPCPGMEDPCNFARVNNPHGRENWDAETRTDHTIPE